MTTTNPTRFTPVDPSLIREYFSYDKDTGQLTWLKPRRAHSVGRVAGSINKDGYRRITIFGQEYLAHRLIWLYVHGTMPEKFIDHINRVKDDNRMENLRECTHAENHQNRYFKLGESGVPGVSKTGAKFLARIKVGMKDVHLGVFDTAEKAGEAYLEAKSIAHPISAGVIYGAARISTEIRRASRNPTNQFVPHDHDQYGRCACGAYPGEKRALESCTRNQTKEGWPWTAMKSCKSSATN